MESVSSLGAAETSHRQPTPGGRGSIPGIQGCGSVDRRSSQCRGGRRFFISHDVTEDERTAWNAKADASALSTKADTSVFDAHTNDAVAHITEKERETWNSKQDKLTDKEGNMTLTGGLAAPTATINGIFNVHNYSTDPLDTNYIHGRTWCYGQVELRGRAVLRNDLWVEDGVIRINGGGRASLLANGAVHLRGAVDATTCINANGGVNIPLSALTSLSNTTALNAYWAAGLMGVSDI